MSDDTGGPSDAVVGPDGLVVVAGLIDPSLRVEIEAEARRR
jgi:hypothetical protein